MHHRGWVKAENLKVGDTIRFWFNGGGINGESTVMEVLPYRGNYKDIFSHEIKITAANTRKGFMVIPVEPVSHFS